MCSSCTTFLVQYIYVRTVHMPTNTENGWTFLSPIKFDDFNFVSSPWPSVETSYSNTQSFRGSYCKLWYEPVTVNINIAEQRSCSFAVGSSVFSFSHLMQSDGFSSMVWLPFLIILPLFRTQSCRTSSVVFPIRSSCFWSTRTAALLKQFGEGDGTELGGWRRWSVIIVALQILQTDWGDTFTAL